MKSFISKLTKITLRTQYIILLVMFFLMAIMLFVTFLKGFSSRWSGVFVSLLVISSLIISAYYLRRIPTTNIPVILFVITLIPSLIVIFSSNPVPWNDFGFTIEVAENWLKSPTHLQAIDYLDKFPELVPWILFEAGVIQLFPDNAFLVLRLLTSLAFSLISLSIYYVGKQKSTQVGIIASLLLAFNPGLVFFTSVISNQHFSIAFEMIALVLIYKMLTTKSKHSGIFLAIMSGLLIGIGQLFRPDAWPLIFAIFIFFMLSILSNESKYDRKRLAINILIILFIFLTVTNTFFIIIQNKNVITDSQIRMDIGYKIFIGFRYNSGTFNASDSSLYLDSNSLTRNELLNSRINSYMQNPKSLFELMINKYYVQWGTYSFAYNWLMGYEINQLKVKERSGTLSMDDSVRYQTLLKQGATIENIDGGYYLLLMTFAVLGVWSVVKTIDQHSFNSLLSLVAVLYIASFFIIEVQGRYRYFLIPIMTIFSSFGIEQILVIFSGRMVLET